jgi:hypothetical protein
MSQDLLAVLAGIWAIGYFVGILFAAWWYPRGLGWNARGQLALAMLLWPITLALLALRLAGGYKRKD